MLRDMLGALQELKRQARKNLGLPNADKVDQVRRSAGWQSHPF
jgi:hypothetical protein